MITCYGFHCFETYHFLRTHITGANLLGGGHFFSFDDLMRWPRDLNFTLNVFITDFPGAF